LDDIAEFEILSGSQDVKQLQEKLDNLKSEYDKKVDVFELDSITDLRELYKTKQGFKSDLDWIENEIIIISGGSKEELQQEIDNLEVKIQTGWNKISDGSIYKKQDFEDKNTFRTELSGKVNLLQDEIDDLMNQRKTLYEEINSLTEQVKNLGEEVNNLKTELHGNNQRLDEIQKRLDHLISDELSVKEYDNNLNRLAVELDQKTRAWKIYEDEIEEKENQPLNVSEGLNDEIKSLEKDEHGLEIENAGLESKLNILTNQSMDTCEIEEKIAQLEVKEEELEHEAKSIKLLYELTEYYRENIINQLSEPIREQVNQDLEKIIGPKYSLIFSKEMKPESISVNGEEVEVNNLSYGAQEQIWYLFRLALGVILSKDEPQLVVLDDPLVNTDPERMQTALQILEEYANKMQIIVVTCDVEKYRSLNDANFISLAEIS
jgi:exonuclease SbcC